MGTFAYMPNDDPYFRPKKAPGAGGAPIPVPGVTNYGGPDGPGGPGGDFTAQTNPALDSLQGRYNKYLDNLEGNTGQIMDIAGAKMRDAREGGRTALQNSQGIRGIASSNATANYDVGTQRAVTGAIADVATERERTLGSALQGGLGIARAPGDMALGEKQFGLTAANAERQAKRDTFQEYLALIESNRRSPIYSGSPAGTPNGSSASFY